VGIGAVIYLRAGAQKPENWAEQADDPLVKQELLEFVNVTNEVANNIEDRMTAG
jgi:hypothetical protein